MNGNQYQSNMHVCAQSKTTFLCFPESVAMKHFLSIRIPFSVQNFSIMSILVYSLMCNLNFMKFQYFEVPFFSKKKVLDQNQIKKAFIRHCHHQFSSLTDALYLQSLSDPKRSGHLTKRVRDYSQYLQYFLIGKGSEGVLYFWPIW